ncbi:hypothetical protein [Halalkalibacter sp. APA_J-10(15)]|uniref:hypothetical protein n=1 Tax=unclassified Halalkalibacter TaxID=2893063 RepID=UPI002795D4D9|nr:hypothetical protein [Halalkalibacter sp. APA_J-10(15)]
MAVFVASAAFFNVLTALTALTALTVFDVITVSAVGEGNRYSRKFSYLMEKMSLHDLSQGITFLVNHKGQIKLHKMIVPNLNRLEIRRS